METIETLKYKLKECCDLADELEEISFDGLSFSDCERELNDALGHNKDVSWNDMIKEVGIIKSAYNPKR